MKSIWFWRRNLTARLVCSFLILSLLIVSLVGIIAYFQATESLTRSVDDRLDAVATLKENVLNNWIDDQTQNVVMIAGIPGIRKQSGILFSSTATLQERKQAYAELSGFLPQVISRTTYMDEISIIDLNGTIAVSSDRAHEGQSVAQDPYFSEGRSRTLATTVYSSTPDKKPAIIIVTPLFDMQGKRTGVLASRLSLAHIDRIILERTGLGTSGETYLVDQSHRIISETPLMKNGTSSRFVQSEGINSALHGTEGSGFYRNYAGVPVVGVYRWMDNQDMALLAEMSQEEALAPARELALTILYTGIILSLILTAGMYLLARQITKPILEIADTAARVTAGDLSRQAPVLTEDEVGLLAVAFNDMTGKLRQTLEGLETNLHELRERDDALQKSEHKYRTLLENIPHNIFRKDSGSVYVSCNENYASTLGMMPEEITGKTDFDLYPGELAEKYRNDDKRVMMTGRAEEYTEQYLDDGKVRWINTIKTPVKDIEGVTTGILGVFWDITERKAAEEELHRLYNELENRVEDRTAELRRAQESYRQANEKLNLLSSITRHDILNQLAALKGYLELSAYPTHNAGELQEFIKKAQKNADTIEHQILFTREYQDIGVKAPAWQSVNLSVIRAKGTLNLGNVEVTLDRADLEVYADPLFDKVFYNLLDNALRYGGDKLTKIRISSYESDSGLVLGCEDDGAGISEPDKKRLFQRGFGKNTGLGLYLSREILLITGITITENSRPGSGARFLITVPNGAWRFTGSKSK
ncbi:PAS domain-containing protein [uncultured Methanoregula sp.]|uniref:PAS domain-containing protein n=1 Tax=uncultured Methanoregula sp. TaxID=1005933 RepID=UPI002AAAAEB0|nr:cache domain-containing protein [uncultured Methanoregula sp.]